MQGFLLLAVATITGPLFDRGYARSLVLTGSLLIVLGMAMTSLSNKYWQVMLAQGLCTGLGGGCLFVPSIAIIPTYFVKKRASAMGFATAGAGLGGVLYAILFYRLEPKIGFGWATRAVAVMVLVTQLIPLAAIKQRVKPSRVRRMIDSSALREPSFVMMGCSVFFAALGLFIPFFYVQVFAQQEHITKGPLGFYVLAILNAGSCVGRLVSLQRVPSAKEFADGKPVTERYCGQGRAIERLDTLHVRSKFTRVLLDCCRYHEGSTSFQRSVRALCWVFHLFGPHSHSSDVSTVGAHRHAIRDDICLLSYRLAYRQPNSWRDREAWVSRTTGVLRHNGCNFCVTATVC